MKPAGGLGRPLLKFLGFYSPDEQTYTPINDTEEEYVPPMMDRGSAGLLLQAASYFDPSVAAVLGPPTAALPNIDEQNRLTEYGAGAEQMVPGKQPGQAGKNKENRNV